MKIYTTLLLISVFSASGCAGFNKAEILTPVQCAIIGNTYAESPFLAPNVSTAKLISSVIKSNPAFTIHTGNNIYAGDSEGLREVDVIRQYDEQIPAFERITPLKRVPGEFDLFKGNIAFYTNKTGSRPDYSFMYGKMLFIMLNSSSGSIQPSQLTWISSEIDLYDNISAIFVVTNLPLFAPKNTQTRFIKNASALHDFFVKEEVKGVISGYGETLFSVEKDGIKYVNAGCVPVSKPVYNNQWHYYTITLSNRILDVQGKNW